MNLALFWSDGFKTGFSSLPCTLLYIILICFPFRVKVMMNMLCNMHFTIRYENKTLKKEGKRSQQDGIFMAVHSTSSGTGYEQVMNSHSCFCHFVQFLLCTGNKTKHKERKKQMQ